MCTSTHSPEATRIGLILRYGHPSPTGQLHFPPGAGESNCREFVVSMKIPSDRSMVMAAVDLVDLQPNEFNPLAPAVKPRKHRSIFVQLHP